MSTYDTGESFFSILRSDYPRAAHDVFSVPMDMLPARIAPFEKSFRVFVNNTEYALDDPNLLVRPSTQSWTTSVGAAVTGGVPCWGVRLNVTTVGVTGGTDLELTCIRLFDENGDEMTDVDFNYVISTPTQMVANECFDNDNTTDFTMPNQGGGTSRIIINFPKQLAVSKIGWNCFGTGASSTECIASAVMQVNLGKPGVPVWTSVGSNLTQDVGNSQDNHEAGAALDASDYDASFQGAGFLEAELLTLTSDVTSGTFERTITIVPELANESDRVILYRETRQDRPWVEPIRGARAFWQEGIKYYFEQIRFIVQELCEYDDVNTWMNLGLSTINLNDYSDGNQLVLHASGGETLSYATVDLLAQAPGADLHDVPQLIVQHGETTGGNSDTWTTMTFSASPGLDTAYSVDESAQTITIGGGGQSNDVRIRRSTRTDKYWVNFDNVPPGWSTATAGLVQRQAQFMMEESCWIPGFYNESPLSTTIFPRAWNWFRFVGTRERWSIPGGAWGGNGDVSIWVNDVEQTEGVDYRVEFPGIIWLISEPGDDDTVDIGSGSGGWGGVTMGGGDTDEDGTIIPGGDPVPLPPVDWPPNNIPVGFGISLSISSKTQTALEAGEWEGGAVSFSQGNSMDSEFNGHTVRINITVTAENIISDGGGGFLPVGAQEILYIGKKCDATAFANASAFKADPGDAYTTAAGSAALGCLDADGATTSLNLWNLAAVPIDATSAANSRFVDALLGTESHTGTGAQPNITEGVPFFNNFLNLAELHDAADTAGVAGNDYFGFTEAQWDDYVDPAEVMEDYDIPPV